MKVDLDSQEIQLVRSGLMNMKVQLKNTIEAFTREDTKELVKEDIKDIDSLIKKLEG